VVASAISHYLQPQQHYMGAINRQQQWVVRAIVGHGHNSSAVILPSAACVWCWTCSRHRQAAHLGATCVHYLSCIPACCPQPSVLEAVMSRSSRTGTARAWLPTAERPSTQLTPMPSYGHLVCCSDWLLQAVGFFIPTLDAAHSVADCEVTLTAMQDGQGSNGSTAAAAAAAEASAAGAGECRSSRPKAVRRSSCLIVEPTAQNGPADTTAAAAAAAAAGLGQTQAAAGGNRRTRRASVIVTDIYTLGAASSFQHASETHTAAANTQPPGVEAEHKEPAREPQPVLVQPQPQLGSTATADSSSNKAGSSCAVASRKPPAVSGFASHAQCAFSSPALEQPVSHIQAPPLSHTLQQLSQHSMSGLLLLQQQQQPHQRLVQQQQQQQQQHSSSFGLQQRHLQGQASLQAAAAAASKPQDTVMHNLRQQLTMLLERNEINMRATARRQQPSASASLTMQARQGSSPASLQPMLRHRLSDEGNSFGAARSNDSTSSASPQPKCGTVRALVTHGGSFRRDSTGGSVEYVAGEQRLIVLDRACSARELREQLSGLGGVCFVEVSFLSLLMLH